MKRHAPTLLFTLPLLVALLSVAALSQSASDAAPLVTAWVHTDLASDQLSGQRWLDLAHIDLANQPPQRPVVPWALLRNWACSSCACWWRARSRAPGWAKAAPWR